MDEYVELIIRALVKLKVLEVELKWLLVHRVNWKILFPRLQIS